MPSPPTSELPARDESDRLLPRIQRAFWGGIAAVSAVALTAIALHWYATVSRDRVLHYRDVLHVAHDARARMTDLQTSIHDYLLARDVPTLVGARDAATGLNTLVDSLVTLAGTDTVQQRAARAVPEALDAWQSGFVTPLTTAAVRGTGPIPDPDEGDRLFSRVRSAVDAVIALGEDGFLASVRREGRIDTAAILVILAELFVIAIALVGIRRRTLGQTGRLMQEQRTTRRQALELELRATELERQLGRTGAMAEYLQTVNTELRETVVELSRTRAEKQSAVLEQEESRATLDVVLAGAPVGIALVDRAMRYERVNDAFAGLGGGAAAEYADRAVGDVTSQLAEVLQPAIASVLETERPQLGVEIDIAPTGDPLHARHWILNLHPVRGPLGRVRAVGVVAIEMTEQKQLERQLMQAQKMEAIGRLAGSIAHDFNNLLTAISAFAQFSRESVPADAPAREDIDQILLATERGAALTRRLLAFSRQQVVEPRPVDLNKVVEDVDEMLRRLIGADVVLETRLAPDLRRIDADPGQIEQVILNLAINARDAMPDGGVIMLETAMAELDAGAAGPHGDLTPGPHVVLTVRDTGIGMDAVTQARAFEPFFTTKSIGKGTGLGLSTVYGIVRQFRGSITFDSEVGLGTTFRVAFPRSGESEDARPEEAPLAEANRLPPVSILLVEDDASVRSTAHRTLKKAGCTVHEAPNGRDALDLLARLGGWVHLVITDLVMPEMGGLQFAREVRGKSPTTRILFISGYTADARLRRTLAETGALYLEKPFTAAALVARVREALGEAGSTGGVAA